MSSSHFTKIISSRHKIRYSFILIISLIYIVSSDLSAQSSDMVFERINTSHGLSNNQIKVIFQDSKGYLWIGTDDGLNKYNGYSFEVFRNDPQDTSSISDNRIWSLFEDSFGELWIGTEDGLNKYNRGENNFSSWFYSNADADFSNTVLGFYEDTRNNTLWLGTVFEGLTKFDRNGKTFKYYLPDSARGAGTANVVYQIKKDHLDDNKLWLGQWDAGFGYFDVEKEKFTSYKYDPKNKNGLSSARVTNLNYDSDGIVWLSLQDGGVNRFDPKTETFKYFKHDLNNKNSLSHDNVNYTIEDSFDKNILWIATIGGGLNKLNKSHMTFEVFKSDAADYNTISSDQITRIFIDETGVMWLGTTGGLSKVDPGRVPFRHYNKDDEKKNWLNSNSIRSVHKSLSDPDIVWIGTEDQGLNRYNKKTKTFSYFKNNPKDKNSLSNNFVLSLYEDQNETLWIGTVGGGLNKYDLNTNKFQSYVLKNNDENSLSSNVIRRMYKTRDGMLWLATSNGLNKFDREKELFTRYTYKDTTYSSEINSLISKYVSGKIPVSSILKVPNDADISKDFQINKATNVLVIALAESDGRDLWDSGWLENGDSSIVWKAKHEGGRHAGGGAKNRINIWTGILEKGSYRLRYKSDDSHAYDSWNVVQPANTNMWGIQLFEISGSDNKTITQNINKFEKPKSIVGSGVQAIVEDSYGMLWIGTENGLSKLDRKTEQFTNFVKVTGDKTSLSHNNIYALHEDKLGNLWVATRDGLNKYISESNSFKSYTIADGLPNNRIFGILEDNNGHIWLSTSNGISKFNPSDEKENGYLTFINYNTQDGLPYNQYVYTSNYKSEDGEMFFGGFNGFVSFYPGKVNPQPPRTILSDFLVYNQSVIPGEDAPIQKHISEIKDITLSADQNAFSFEFVAMHFSRPEKNQYMYKMEGFDKDWVDGHRRFAPYTNLDPGKYTFKVKASNSDGIWNNEGATVTITILPPWWRTIWAYIGYALFLVGAFFAFDRLQRRRLLAKTKERMKIQTAEHRAEAAELEARAAKAENERKTKELEEARDLQLSMLPKELPQLPNLDIAVYMQTATEVGGDYYDFHVGLDGTLTVVIGDATGHGMKAGTMVTTAKSLFNSYAPNPDILFTFSEITRCIKQMNFGKLSMCMTMAKIKGNKLEISTAGMPPSFIFRRDTRVVEEHMFKAMPLGTMEKFPYELKDTTLNPGDTILLMSDGLPELNNDSGEMYGYKRIRNGFEDVAEKAPEEIISYLKNEGSSWVNDEAPDDDVTFVVIKVK